MSKLEESSWPVGKCLCGKETIVRHSFSMDHGYGGGSSHDYLECDECAKVWRLEGRHFVHIVTEKAARQCIESARARQANLELETKRITDNVISRIYANTKFQNQTREWEEATRNGLFTGSLKDFKKIRRGRQFIDVVTADTSLEWFQENATENEIVTSQALRENLNSIHEEIASAQASIQRVEYELV